MPADSRGIAVARCPRMAERSSKRDLVPIAPRPIGCDTATSDLDAAADRLCAALTELEAEVRRRVAQLDLPEA